MKRDCLKEDEILAYVDGQAGPALREKVEAHIASCPECLHAVAELRQLVDSHRLSPVSAPPAAVRRATEIVRSALCPAPVFSIVAAFQEGILRILKTTGSLLPPPRLEPVTVRGARRGGLVPRVSKSLSGYLVTVKLSPEESGFAAEVTLLKEGTSEQPDGVKARLLAGDKVETRYSRDGRLLFTSVAGGASVLDIEGVGRITLDIG